jgi:hypothetical protein
VKVIGNLTKDAIIRAAVSEGLTVTQAVGTEVTMNSGSTTGFAAAFDSSTGKVVIAFSDGTDGQKGKAVVGTVDPSNNSISFGSEVVFQNSEITGDQMDCVFDSNANKVVIFYTDTNNPSTNDRTGTAIVGTVSGTSISFGTKVAFESGITQYINATFDSNANKVVVAYQDASHSGRGKAIVGTVSGTSISFGSETDFSTANEVEYISATFDSNSNKVVISWNDKGNNSQAGTSIVGTVSGTSISFGSAVVFEAPITKDISSTFDTVNNKVIITYKDQGNSSYGTAIVGTVSGTSISFGTAVVFASAETEYTSVVYDTAAGKIAIVYKDGGNSNRPTFISGTVSGTSITFDTETVLKAVEGVTINPGLAYDSTNERVVAAYIDTTGSDNGLAQVIRVGYTSATGGTIADGKAVIVNANGTVSTVSTSTESLGSLTQFESGGIIYVDITYDTTNDKVVIVYRDKGNSNYGTAVVGTVSGESISFGTPVVYNSANSGWNACAFDENAGKVGIFYEDHGASRYGKSVVGTVSGTSISFGSEAEFHGVQVSDIDAVYDSTAQKIVVSYKNHSNNYANAIVGTISGTSISFGSSASFSGSQTMSSYTAIGYDSTNDKVVAVYNQASDYDGYAAVGTVSGTGISFGTAVKFMTGTMALAEVVFDSSNQKINIFFSDGTNSDYIEGVIGTVSGTTISFTSEQTLYNAAGVGTAMCAVYNPKSASSIIVFRGASAYGLIMPVTSSGTSLTAGSISTITTNAIGVTEAVYDPDQEKVVAALQDGDDSDKGKAVVYTASASTLTTENFVGFMKGAALDGTNGEILSSCSIARNQTSLTPGQTYFVSPTDGALSLTAGSPSVTAGTAISNTDLIVKG